MSSFDFFFSLSLSHLFSLTMIYPKTEYLSEWKLLTEIRILGNERNAPEQLSWPLKIIYRKKRTCLFEVPCSFSQLFILQYFNLFDIFNFVLMKRENWIYLISEEEKFNVYFQISPDICVAFNYFDI